MHEEIKLGMEVRDTVTELKGIVIARCEYLNGCVQFGVAQKSNPDGTVPDHRYIDVGALKVIGKGLTDDVIVDEKVPGGPQRHAPRG